MLKGNKRLLSNNLSGGVRRMGAVRPSSRCTLKPKSSLSSSKEPWKLANISQHDTVMTQHDQKVHAISWCPDNKLLQSHVFKWFLTFIVRWMGFHGHYQGHNSALADEWWASRLQVGAPVVNEDLFSRLVVTSGQNIYVKWKGLWTNKSMQNKAGEVRSFF